MGYSKLQREAFSIDAVLAELVSSRTGGVTLYVGTVRGQEEGRSVEALTYEAFPEMAMDQLEALRKDTIRQFGLTDAVIIHRLGTLHPGEPILLVALAGAHRGETFDAVRHFMDRLKEIVPIWKREESPDGATWVVGRERKRVRA